LNPSLRRLYTRADDRQQRPELCVFAVLGVFAQNHTSRVDVSRGDAKYREAAKTLIDARMSTGLESR
jgi:hypothetical protein